MPHILFLTSLVSMTGLIALGALPSDAITTDWTKFGFEGILAGVAMGCVYIMYRLFSAMISPMLRDILQKANDIVDKLELSNEKLQQLNNNVGNLPCTEKK